jgi:hypothetical protein
MDSVFAFLRTRLRRCRARLRLSSRRRGCKSANWPAACAKVQMSRPPHGGRRVGARLRRALQAPSASGRVGAASRHSMPLCRSQPPTANRQHLAAPSRQVGSGPRHDIVASGRADHPWSAVCLVRDTVAPLPPQPHPQGRPETGILPADIKRIFRSQVSALRSLARVFRSRYRSRANSDPEPVPVPEDLNLSPDRRDPRPESNYYPYPYPYPLTHLCTFARGSAAVAPLHTSERGRAAHS